MLRTRLSSLADSELPSVPAALMEKTCFLLSPGLQIKARAVVQPALGRGAGHQAALGTSSRNHSREHFLPLRAQWSLLPPGSGVTGEAFRTCCHCPLFSNLLHQLGAQ